MVQMNQFARQKLRHRCREQTYGHQGGKVAGGWRGGGMMNWEIGIDMYTVICIKLMTNKDLPYKKINKIKLKKKSMLTHFALKPRMWSFRFVKFINASPMSLLWHNIF